jgi:hypothetical protein
VSQLSKKVNGDPISTKKKKKKLDMVVHAYNPSYCRGISKKDYHKETPCTGMLNKQKCQFFFFTKKENRSCWGDGYQWQGKGYKGVGG